MKYIICCIVLLLNVNFNLFSQNRECDSNYDAIYIKTNEYEGVILGPKCLKRLLIKDGDTIDAPRWTPTMQDIENAEKLIENM